MALKYSMRSLLLLPAVLGLALAAVLLIRGRIRQREQLVDALIEKGIAVSFEQQKNPDSVSLQ
jgi:hypothetical protein